MLLGLLLIGLGRTYTGIINAEWEHLTVYIITSTVFEIRFSMKFIENMISSQPRGLSSLPAHIGGDYTVQS